MGNFSLPMLLGLRVWSLVDRFSLKMAAHPLKKRNRRSIMQIGS